MEHQSRTAKHRIFDPNCPDQCGNRFGCPKCNKDFIFASRGKRRQYGAKAKLIWERSKGKCWYCGTDMVHSINGSLEPNAFTIDHKIPLSEGGSKTLKNLIGSCYRCNNAKKSFDQEYLRLYLSLQKAGINFSLSQKRYKYWLKYKKFSWSIEKKYKTKNLVIIKFHYEELQEWHGKTKEETAELG